MPAWKGFLKLSLVSVPIRGTSATSTSEEVRLNQLHGECHSRIRYQKTCPEHGEVTQDEIVSGYEYAKGQYVVVDPREFQAAKGERERAIEVDAVVPLDKIEPIYFTSKTYYLTPDGKSGNKPFALVQKALAERNLCAVGKVTLTGREEVVLVRPVGKVLAMTALKFPVEVRSPDIIKDEIESPELEPEALGLASELLGQLQPKKFSLDRYTDTYVEKLREFIEAKVKGKEVVAPPPMPDEPQVINIMEALRKSVRASGAKSKAEPSARKRRAAKKKSG